MGDPLPAPCSLAQLPPLAPPSPAERMCLACREAGRCRFGLTVGADADGRAIGHVTFTEVDSVVPGVVHGGLVSAVLDEMCGNAPLNFAARAATVTLEVSFLAPVPVEEPLEARAWIARRDGRRWSVVADLRVRGTSTDLATARGLFLEAPSWHPPAPA